MNNTPFIVIFSTLILCLLFILLMLWRNGCVSAFLTCMLREEGEYLNRRIEAGKGYDGYRRYNSLPTYDHLLYHFWHRLSFWEKPLSDYYKENE